MKTILSLVFVATAVAFTSCGPSAEEKAKKEAEAKAKMDSIFNAAAQATTEISDSTAVDTAHAVEQGH